MNDRDVSGFADDIRSLKTQGEPEEKNTAKDERILQAVANWIAHDNNLLANSIIAKWRSHRNVDQTAQHQSATDLSLHPLLALASGYDDVTKVDENGRTILYHSLCHMPEIECNNSWKITKQMKNDTVLIKSLCEIGASIIVEDNCGDTPLKVALVNKRMDLVDVMIQHNTKKVADCNSQGDTILHILLTRYIHDKSGDNEKFLSIIDTILYEGADVNKPNNEGLTPVHLTAKPFYKKVLKKFLSHGADLNYGTTNGDNLLMLACQHHYNSFRQEEINWINWLLKLGCNVNSTNKIGFTPLLYASNYGSADVIKLLAKAGADLRAVNHDGHNCMDLVITSTDTSAVICLIEQGVEFNRRDIKHGAILMHALRNSGLSHKKGIKWLTKYGLNKNEKGDLTMLHLAAMFGFAIFVKMLLKYGTDVHARDGTFEYTPLHLASVRRQFHIVPEIKEAGLISGQVDGEEAYFETAEAGITDMYEDDDDYYVDYEYTILALLEAGADVNAKDRYGRTPLHYAARHTDENDSIVLLLHAGADIDDLDSENLSPLHNSLLGNNERGLMHLLSFGTDINDIEHPHRDICSEIEGLNSSKSGVKNYLATLQIAGLPINNLYKPHLQNENYQEHYIEYVEELKVLKTKMLTPNISLYDWMHMNTNWRFSLIDKLPLNIEVEFKHYATVIQSLSNQAFLRKPLLEPATMSYHELTDWQWPDICAERVISFLDNRTLKVLIDMRDEE